MSALPQRDFLPLERDVASSRKDGRTSGRPQTLRGQGPLSLLCGIPLSAAWKSTMCRCAMLPPRVPKTTSSECFMRGHRRGVRHCRQRGVVVAQQRYVLFRELHQGSRQVQLFVGADRHRAEGRVWGWSLTWPAAWGRSKSQFLQQTPAARGCDTTRRQESIIALPWTCFLYIYFSVAGRKRRDVRRRSLDLQ